MDGMGGSGFLKEIPAGFEETCPFLIVTVPQGRPKVGAGGPMDALEGSRLCGETVPFGAAVGCTVQLTQSTEEGGDPRAWERPRLCTVRPHGFMSVPHQDQRPAWHTPGAQTTLQLPEHMRLVNSTPWTPSVILRTPHCSHL